MAVISPTFISIGQENGNRVYKWAGIIPGDTMLPLNVYGASDLTFEIAGAIGSTAATIALQGCLQIDIAEASRTYTTLQRGNGSTNLSFAALGIWEVIQIPVLLKPIITGGVASVVDVYIKWKT